MKLFKLLKWSAAHTAWLTMAFSPVALGAEAEKLSKQKLGQYVQEFGLNKTTTVGDFWEKTKRYYPGYTYRQIEHFVKQNRNLVMPEVLVSSSKGPDGNEVPVLQFTKNGKTTTIQIYGEKSKWAKVNNTVLSTHDMQRPQDVFKRLMANDIRLKKEADVLKAKTEGDSQEQIKIQSQQQKDFARFEGFPRLTPQLWKSMTPIQRASFIINMRLMWMSAQKVYDAHSRPSRTSYDPLFEKMIQMALGETAEANTAKVIPRVYNANSCIVAGYVGVYDRVENNRGKNRQGCSVDKAVEEYRAREILNDNGSRYITKANAHCATSKGNNFVACNPIIYGYPKGEAACVDKKDISFQTATHYKGACDAQSPLNSMGQPLFKDKDYSQIMPREKQLAVIDQDQKQQGYELTNQFLEGVLKHKDSALFDAFKNGTWTEKLDSELLAIQSSFEDEINGAIKTCEADIKHKNEPNQKGACDQLHRRWLFTEKFLIPLRQKACPPETKFIGSFDKLDDLSKNPFLCECVNDNKVQGPIGPKHDYCPTPAVAVPEKEKPEVIDTPNLAPVVDKSCPSSTTFVSEGTCACVANKEITVEQTTDPVKAKEVCEGKDNSWLWALGIGAGLLALFAIFGRNKDKTPPTTPPQGPLCEAGKKLEGGACICSTVCSPTKTQNPVTCGCDVMPVVVQCPAPKVGTPPSCMCPSSNSCTPGQQIYNQVTCQCDNVPQPITCSNGSAPINGICPKCPDGSPMPIGGCPVINEGGSGDPCPSKKCNGGVPTNN